MSPRPSTTHYFTFRHDTTGLTTSSFTCHLIKNGDYINSIPVEVEQVSNSGDDYLYKAFFLDDGTSPCTWELIVVEDTGSAVSDTNPAHYIRLYIETDLSTKLLSRLRGGSEY